MSPSDPTLEAPPVVPDAKDIEISRLRAELAAHVAARAAPPAPITLEYAARSLCLCGELLVRSSPGTSWRCRRIATGDKPTSGCVTLPIEAEVLTVEEAAKRDALHRAGHPERRRA